MRAPTPRRAPPVVYLSSLGMRCRIVTEGRRGTQLGVLHFEYLDGAQLAGTGFALRHENLRIMRKLP